MRPRRYSGLLVVQPASSTTLTIWPRRTLPLPSTLEQWQRPPTNMSLRSLSWKPFRTIMAGIRTFKHQVVRVLWTQLSSSQAAVTQTMWCCPWEKTPIRFQSQSTPHISWTLREKSQIYVIILTCSFIFAGIIKNKLKQYLHDQDITLQTLFNLMDSNSDGHVSLAELKQKLKMLHTPLEDGEMNILF